MKTQTKIATLVTVLVIGLSSVVSAQGISFGLRGGANFQNINGKTADGSKLTNKLIPGFNAGITVEIPVAPEFYVQPGLLFSTKGAQTSEVNGKLIEGTSKLHLSYVELPINFLFKPALGSGNMILGFGPYVAYGVGGKFNIDGKLGPLSYNEDWDVVYASEVDYIGGDALDKYYVKPFDAGANFIIGYQTGMGLSVQLNAQLGLLNMLPEVKGVDMKDATQKNTGFGISLGYHF